MKDIHIERVSVQDLVALKEISSSTFFETFSESNTKEDMEIFLENNLTSESLERELKDDNSVFFFIYWQDHLAGYLKVNFGEAQSELQKEDLMEIERIYVRKEFQGQRLGNILMGKAFEIARMEQCAAIWLGVWEKNIKAIAFYRKLGFVGFGEHIFLLGNDPQTDILMRLELTEK